MSPQLSVALPSQAMQVVPKVGFAPWLQVLASMFDAMSSTGGTQSTSSDASAATTSAAGPRRSARGPSKRRREQAVVAADDGGGDGSAGAGSSGGSGGVDPRGRLRLETPFNQYSTDVVIRFLRMIYDTSSIADSVVCEMMGDLAVACKVAGCWPARPGG